MAPTPLRYRPAPVSIIVKRAKSRIARREFGQRLAEDPQAAMEEANAKLEEASRQEENRATFLSAQAVENGFDYETILHSAKDSSS